MGKKEIIKIIKNSKPEMESRYGVTRLGLFGSYVREKQGGKSDIDILVIHSVIFYCTYRHSGGSRNPGKNWMPDQVRHDKLFEIYVVIYSFNRDIDLFDFLDLREYLESQLRVKVDLVMDSALKPAIGKRILSEVEYV